MAPATSARPTTRRARQSAHRSQNLSPVQQGQTLLGLQPHRFDAGSPHRLTTGQALAKVERLALADHAQRHVRQRRQVAAGTHRSFFRDHRVHATVQHRRQGPRHHGTHAAVSERQRVCAQRQDRARLGFRKRTANPTSVTANEVELQPVDFVFGNPHLAQLAETGVDPVHGPIAVRRLTHNALRPFHLRHCFRRDIDALFPAGDSGNFGQGEWATTE
jgi:hypothetical protein